MKTDNTIKEGDMNNKWKSQSFSELEGSLEILSDKVANFLNERNIDEFVVVRMGDNYIEIVYKTNED